MTREEVAPFGHMRLAGGRFEKADGLPVSSAAELERYSNLIGEVARGLFLNAHPGRKRVPRGFDDSFELRLTRITRGSQIPELVRPIDPNQATLFAEIADTDWHEEARRLINSALGSITDEDTLPPDFPPSALKRLAQFGRGLQKNEKIELANSANDEPLAVLTTETRKRIQRLAQLDELEVETVLVGQVTGLSSTPPSVDVTTSDGPHQRTINATFSDDSVWDALRTHLGYASKAPSVALSVIAVQNRSGDIVKITDIIHAEPALPPSWNDRLQHLAALKADWLFPGSEAPTPKVIERVESILLAILDAELTGPAIYPSGDGGIQLEWRTSTRTAEIEILNSGVIEAIWYEQTHDENGDELTLDTNDPYAVADFVKGAIDE